MTWKANTAAGGRKGGLAGDLPTRSGGRTRMTGHWQETRGAGRGISRRLRVLFPALMPPLHCNPRWAASRRWPDGWLKFRAIAP